MTIHADTIPDFDEALKALSNPVRRKILARMKDPAANFPGQEHSYDLGVCAGRIDVGCGLSQSTISAHLAILQHAGLITSRRVGQWIFYKRDEGAISAFLQHLGQSL
ncbi:MAG: metalloregulator ArsR/SmtB family transcription factor [Acidocella sp.]|nr:metalloregulator ArsR/SmtB family transcription factor [Acidocella sp.]